MLKVVQDMSASMRDFHNKLREIKSTLRKFLYVLLDLCTDNDALELFLDKDDQIEGLGTRSTDIHPRILQALHLKHKDFVNHDSCQQVC